MLSYIYLKADIQAASTRGYNMNCGESGQRTTSIANLIYRGHGGWWNGTHLGPTIVFVLATQGHKTEVGVLVGTYQR